METENFLTWLGAIALVATFALGVMAWAYVGSGSRAVVFREPVASQAVGEGEAYVHFQRGYNAFRAGKYRRAVERFGQVVQGVELAAEAHHNTGLAYANLRQDNDAVRSLVKAGELYLEQSDQAGYERVKQDLQTMKDRSLAARNLQKL